MAWFRHAYEFDGLQMASADLRDSLWITNCDLYAMRTMYYWFVQMWRLALIAIFILIDLISNFDWWNLIWPMDKWLNSSAISFHFSRWVDLCAKRWRFDDATVLFHGWMHNCYAFYCYYGDGAKDILKHHHNNNK